jgi:hypothetical protein
MAYTLKNSGVNGNVAFEIGSVGSERMVKNAEIETLPLPLSDSSSTIVFDNEGTVRTISLTGRFTADTQAELMNDFILLVEGIVNGGQTLTKTTYHSDLYDAGTGKDGNFTCVIQSFSWTYSTESKNIVDYDIVLIEGT